MGSTRHTCENKPLKTCQQERKEIILLDHKGDPQFEAIICTHCYGTVAFTKLEKPKAEKPKVEKPKATKEIEAPKAKASEKTTQEESPAPEKKPEPTKSDDGEKGSNVHDFIDDLEKGGIETVDLLLKIKSEFGLSNREAANILKDRAALKREKVSDNQNDVEPEQEEVKQEVKEEPKVEAKEEAPKIPSPLPEKEEKERQESPVKPSNRTVREVEEKITPFPIVSLELDQEKKAYKFELVTEDAVTFKLNVVPNPEKFDKVNKNPSLFDNQCLLLRYSKVDQNDLPVDPVITGVKPQ